MATTLNDDFDDYMGKIRRVKLPKTRKDLKHGWSDKETAITPENINKWIKEGNQLLELEAAQKTKEKATKNKSEEVVEKPEVKSNNPYAQARQTILNKMSPELKANIEKMEKGEIPKDKTYQDFINAIIKLGDSN